MKRKGFDPIIEVQDDGLIMGDSVGIWAEEKYSLLGLYCDIFTTSMHKKWDNLIYIDLFSGCGCAKIEKSKRILRSSPLIALSIPIKFNKYIFCEENKNLCSALKERVQRYFKEENVIIINGDCNKEINNIIKQIHSKNPLCFCFSDPYNLKDLHFETIKKLGLRFRIDFLILIATGMDAKRNVEQHYMKESNNIVNYFLEDLGWRVKYKNSGLTFVQFLAQQYEAKMLTLGYKEPKTFQQIKMTFKNVPLYHLAFYSKSDLGNKFWGEVKKYKSIQTELF